MIDSYLPPSWHDIDHKSESKQRNLTLHASFVAHLRRHCCRLVVRLFSRSLKPPSERTPGGKKLGGNRKFHLSRHITYRGFFFSFTYHTASSFCLFATVYSKMFMVYRLDRYRCCEVAFHRQESTRCMLPILMPRKVIRD